MTEPHYRSDRDWHPDPYTEAYTTDEDWATFPEDPNQWWNEWLAEGQARRQRSHDRMSRGFFAFWVLFCVILPIAWLALSH